MAQLTSPAKKCRWSERVADGLKGPGNLDTTATTLNLQQARPTSTVKQQRIPAQSAHHARFFFGAFSLCRSRYLITDHRSRPGPTAPRSTVVWPLLAVNRVFRVSFRSGAHSQGLRVNGGTTPPPIHHTPLPRRRYPPFRLHELAVI